MSPSHAATHYPRRQQIPFGMAKSKLWAISAIPLRIKARRWRCRLRFVSERLDAERGLYLVKSGGQWHSGDLSKARLLKKSAWLLHLNDDKASLTACNWNETVCRLYYSHIGNGGHSWWLSNTTSWSAGLSFQGATMDFNQAAPLTAHCCADVIDLE